MKPLPLLLLAAVLAGPPVPAPSARQTPQDARNTGTRVDVAAALVAAPQGAPDGGVVSTSPPVPAFPGASLQMGPPSPVGGVPQPSGGIGSALIGGWATHYADPKEAANARYAAAGPLLREALGDWRGKVIAVTSGKYSTIVQLVDVCACGERQGLPTIIDLSPAAFRDLAPLSAGVIRVEIELVALPATDVAP